MIQFITGLTAAAAHVVSGPDHLAAVTPLAIESRRKAWGIGLAWGAGHTLGILLIGILFLLFRDVIPVERISEHSELLVGIILILIGAWAISKVFIKSKNHHHHPHMHTTEDGAYIHQHDHDHNQNTEHVAAEAHRHQHARRHRQNIKASLGVGVFHGLAGVSHLLAILPTLALPTKMDAALYLIGFGVGTLAAMMLFAAILGFVSGKTAIAGRAATHNLLRIVGGAAAIIIGIWWIVMAV
ncbi:MAG: sulfite exporter TauE/SafE family protein [Bacteroidales bacterium]|jgi:cation transport ATPase|nr:sulfite exporter TauE/SafE family protein [Bacteroidales bacterium]MDY0334393.1 sulfite exporter TauE/SafE family protein [Bacteroidales bacterium]NCU35372.1 nickel transporter [Candidatus Falkowbacteria bacterium]NLO50789.1 nickel transporter [Bacteroidales bacterium]